MIYTIIAILLLSLTLHYYWKKDNKRVYPGLYILSLYLLSLIGSIFVIELEDNSDYSIKATVYFCVVLLFYLLPLLNNDRFFSKDSLSKQSFALTTKKAETIDLFSSILMIGGIFAIIVFIPAVISVFRSSSSFLTLRTDMIGGEKIVTINKYLYFPATLFSQFYPISITLYFYYLISKRKSTRYCTLLLVSSLSYVVNVLASVGRDGIILWGMSFMFSYFMFRDCISKEQQKTIRKYFVLVVMFFLIPFILITLSRFFSDNSKYTQEDQTRKNIEYFSGQFHNFNRFYNHFSNIQRESDYSLILPFLKRNNDNQQSHYEKYEDKLYKFGIDIFVFSTFLGDFLISIGALSTLILSLFVLVINSIILSKNKNISLGYCIYYTLAGQIPLHGFFYYKLQYTVCNIYVVITLVIAYVLANDTELNEIEYDIGKQKTV